MFFFSAQGPQGDPTTFYRLHTNATCTLAAGGSAVGGRSGQLKDSEELEELLCMPLVVTRDHYVRMHSQALKAAFAVEAGDIISYYHHGQQVPQGPHILLRYHD